MARVTDLYVLPLALVLACALAAAPAVAGAEQWLESKGMFAAVEDMAARHDSEQAPTSPASPPAGPTSQAASGHVGYFLRSINATVSTKLGLLPSEAKWLSGTRHFRLLPGIFPHGMAYHFDGLATVMRLEFNNDGLTYTVRPFESAAEQDYRSCIFFGTGTGPTLGSHLCTQNPAVNLLPIDGQLWLTIDEVGWGRVDMDTLETVHNATVEANTLILNAHPACDLSGPDTVCYVQHPCPTSKAPLSRDVCVSQLMPTSGAHMDVMTLSNTTLPDRVWLQHSHEPCVTQNFVVSKIDSFVLRSPINLKGGLLKYMHQGEGDMWLLFDRRTNVSSVLSSEQGFVSNHFTNCYESEDGSEIVVDTIAATENYLDNYFQYNLDVADGANWGNIFKPPLRCSVPTAEGAQNVTCEQLVQDDHFYMDYPTFNPLRKFDRTYSYVYGISPVSDDSRWFDRIVKLNAQTRTVEKSWAAPGLFFTEADFIPRPGATQEDDGVLLSVVYNETADTSSVVVLDAANVTPIEVYKLPQVVPFHAHGISCPPGQRCWTNP
mmetsp:Transcript_160474/g.389749  ORF Transcript_160474/g.389749 Transcript_160474/m.389749 type:complete len:548 (+) Transcript_160474:239-1882(+)